MNTVAAMMRGEVRDWMELDRFTVRKVATEVAAGMQQWHLQHPLVNMLYGNYHVIWELPGITSSTQCTLW